MLSNLLESVMEFHATEAYSSLDKCSIIQFLLYLPACSTGQLRKQHRRRWKETNTYTQRQNKAPYMMKIMITTITIKFGKHTLLYIANQNCTAT
jgi:hypothetical protein